MFNQWEHVSAMPEAVLHPAVAATNQRIYVFGGEDAMHNPVRIIQVTVWDEPQCSGPPVLIAARLPPAGLPHSEEHVVQDGEQNGEERVSSGRRHRRQDLHHRRCVRVRKMALAVVH